MKFNYNGSQIATSCKDKKLRIFDPRTDAVVQENAPHDGSKCFKLAWLGNGGNIVSVGFTRQSKRQFKIWDPRALGDKPIHTENIDQSAGVILPFYDPDTHVLFLAGKGDGNIRFYEMVPEKPHCFSLSEYRASSSQKGICFLEKRHCDTTKCEVLRAMKLTSNSVEGLSFIIPRKSDRFQADIFPDAKAGSAAMTCEEFFSGKDADPKMISMDPAQRAAGGGEGESKTSGNALKSKGQLQKELDAALARIAELEAEVAKLKA
jgi:coronin-1B/1C/6